MNTFIETIENKKSIALRKPIYGVGINDAKYITQSIINGKRSICPYYQKWHNMIVRCYSAKYQEKRHTYIGCSVCDEWLTFSNFRAWMEMQDWEGKHLDKDIKVKGNKLYSPNTCLLIPPSLNSLLTAPMALRGKYPQGVSWHKASSKFRAYISDEGKMKHLGLFDTPEKASQEYKKVRAEKIQELIYMDTYPQATKFLSQHI